jgi:Domain of unknown function (DUF3303)
MNTYFMVRVAFAPQARETVLTYFAEHGVAAYREHVEVLSHWAAVHEPVSYLLVESKNNEQAQAAFEEWKSLGDVSAKEVVPAADF